MLDKADMVVAGAGELECFEFTSMFDCMGALSTKYNDTPEKASRAFDKNRDGFVIAGGGGMVVLEELEHAKARSEPSRLAKPATSPNVLHLASRRSPRLK